MSCTVNNFQLPVARRLDSDNCTYYTVCSGFWKTLRCLLKTPHLAQAVFDYVRSGLPQHFVIRAGSDSLAVDAAVRLLPLTRERYLFQENPGYFTDCTTPEELLARACAMAGDAAGPERGEQELLTAWEDTLFDYQDTPFPTEGRPETMPVLVPLACAAGDAERQGKLRRRRSPVVLLEEAGRDYGEQPLLCADSSDWPAFTVPAPTARWYGQLMSDYYYKLTGGFHRITVSDCEQIAAQLDIRCENDVIEACDYVRRHEGPRPVNRNSFLQAIRDVPCYGALRGFDPDKSTVLCRPAHMVRRRVPQFIGNTMLIACNLLEAKQPTPYVTPTNAPLTTGQGRALENHLLNAYGSAPCLSDRAGTLLQVTLQGNTCCVDELAVDPGASLARLLEQAEESYLRSPKAVEALCAKPDQWMLVLDAEPFQTDSARLARYRFAIHLTETGGEIYEGPLALKKFCAGFRPMAQYAADHKDGPTGFFEEY